MLITGPAAGGRVCRTLPEYERVLGELLGLGAAGRTVLCGALRTLCSPSHVRLAVRSLSSISHA